MSTPTFSFRSQVVAVAPTNGATVFDVLLLLLNENVLIGVCLSKESGSVNPGPPTTSPIGRGMR